MGKKYIIELEDKPFHKGNGDFLYRVKGFNSLVFDMTGVGKLKPYSRPDTEAIRMEAYDEGYKTAKVQCNIQAEKDLREVGERHYQKGLSDAWDAARKIANMPYGEEEKAFGSGGWAFIEKHTAAEAIEKIRQYEQKQEEIKVGDEVTDDKSDTGVCTEISYPANSMHIMYADGTATDISLTGVTQTGRHFPEIAAILQKMREES